MNLAESERQDDIYNFEKALGYDINRGDDNAKVRIYILSAFGFERRNEIYSQVELENTQMSMSPSLTR